MPKKFSTGENSFATMGELFKCVGKNREGCLFLPVEEISEKLFIKNDDLTYVEKDMKKPYEQLLINIHDELLQDKRIDIENIKHSLKRTNSLFDKIGIASERTTKWIIILTTVTIILMLSQLILQFFRK